MRNQGHISANIQACSAKKSKLSSDKTDVQFKDLQDVISRELQKEIKSPPELVENVVFSIIPESFHISNVGWATRWKGSDKISH